MACKGAAFIPAAGDGNSEILGFDWKDNPVGASRQHRAKEKTPGSRPGRGVFRFCMEAEPVGRSHFRTGISPRPPQMAQGRALSISGLTDMPPSQMVPHPSHAGQVSHSRSWQPRSGSRGVGSSVIVFARPRAVGDGLDPIGQQSPFANV